MEPGYIPRVETGRLEQTSTAELLRRFADAGATGRLDIDRSGMRSLLWFRHGRVYTATAPGSRARLGERLVAADEVSGEVLANALSRQAAVTARPRLGDVLVDGGHLDLETVRSHVREQIVDSVAAALAWTEGTWSFRPGDSVVEDAPLDESVDDLLMEGARRLDRWEVILRRLGSLDTVLDFRGGAAADVALTPDEWSLLTRIDGVSTVAELAGDLGCSELEGARIAYGLVATRILEAVPEPSARSDEEDGAAEARAHRAELLREFASLERAPVPPPSPAPSPSPSPDHPEEPVEATEDGEGPPATGRRGLFRGRRG